MKFTLDTSKVSSLGGRSIQAKDATFIVKRVKTMQWGKYISYTDPKSYWYEYDALFVICITGTLKLAWVDSRSKQQHDEIVNKVKDGHVKCMVDLLEELSKYNERYGAPIKLISTKLEWFYD